MKQRIFITAAIWGTSYIETFIRYNLATQMSPNNIPALASFCDVTYQFLTTPQDKTHLEQNPLFQEMASICTIDWRMLDELFPPESRSNNDKYFFLSKLQNFSMQSAIGHDILIFNYADFVWADGSMRNLVQCFKPETDAILSFCLPVDQKTGSAALDQCAANEKGCIALSPREATRIALDHMHRETRLRIWDAEHFTNNPTYILWQVAQEGFLITAYHQTILAMRVEASNPFYYNGIVTNSLDGYYSAVLATNANIIHANDSDEIFIFSLYETLTNSRMDGTLSKNASLRDDMVYRTLKGSVSEGQRQLALAPIRVYREKTDPRIWDETEQRTIATLKAIHARTEFDPVAYIQMYGSPPPPMSLLSMKQGILRFFIQQELVLQSLRLMRRLVIALFVPADAAFNGGFSRWRRAVSHSLATQWQKLPARGWLGYFEGDTQGTFARSPNTPNTQSHDSLVITGAQGTHTAYLAQKMPAFSLIRTRRNGAFICSGYVRREGNAANTIALEMHVPTHKNQFNDCRNRGEIGNIDIPKADSWEYFTITCNMVVPLARGGMPVFVIKGLTSPHDKVYFSQLKFEAGNTATPFSLRAAWKENFWRPMQYTLDLLRRQRIPTLQGLSANLPLPRRLLDLLAVSHVEELAELMPTRGTAVTLGKYNVLGSEAAVYYEIGLIPEKVMDSISNPEYLMQLLKGAEKSLQHLVRMAPLYIDGHLALARNLWFQSRPRESLQRFQDAERYRLKLIEMLGLKSDAALILPSNCGHSIGLMGHIDAFIKHKHLTGDPRPYHLITDENDIINKPFFDYWKPFLKLHYPNIEGADIPTVAMAYSGDWNWAMPQDAFTTAHVHTAIARIQRQWSEQKRPPLLQLTAEHQALLNAFKALQGMKENDWYVCLHVRSSAFYNDNASQDFRNTPIQDYYHTIEEIVAAGGWVIRMGDPSMPKLQGIAMDHVIDYAHSEERTPALDVALSAGCKLFVSVSSGLHTVAHAFGRPVCLVNIPLYAGCPWHPGEIFIPKLYYSLAHHRILSMEEILSSDLVHADHQHQLAARGIILLRNTPDEIAQTVLETLDRTRYSLPEGIAPREEFERLNQHYDRNISGQLGLYFARKHQAALLPLAHQSDDANAKAILRK